MNKPTVSYILGNIDRDKILRLLNKKNSFRLSQSEIRASTWMKNSIIVEKIAQIILMLGDVIIDDIEINNLRNRTEIGEMLKIPHKKLAYTADREIIPSIEEGFDRILFCEFQNDGTVKTIVLGEIKDNYPAVKIKKDKPTGSKFHGIKLWIQKK